MSSFWEMLQRIRINVLQFFVPIGSSFIFWLRRKLNLTVTCRQVLPPFPDPEIPLDELSDGTDGTYVVQPEVIESSIFNGALHGSRTLTAALSSRNYGGFTSTLHRTSTATSEFAYLFENRNFSYVSDTDAGSPTTNPETDSD